MAVRYKVYHSAVFLVKTILAPVEHLFECFQRQAEMSIEHFVVWELAKIVCIFDRGYDSNQSLLIILFNMAISVLMRMSHMERKDQPIEQAIKILREAFRVPKKYFYV